MMQRRFAVLLVALVACKKPPPPAPKADASARPTPAFPVASTNASAALAAGPPWAGLPDPEVAVIGEPFVSMVKVPPDCKPSADWEPAGVVVKLPLPPGMVPEADRLHFRAAGPGTAKLHVMCGTSVVADREITVITSDEAVPYAEMDAGAYGEALAPMIEDAREAALGCFATELENDAAVRGAGTMYVRVDPNGDIGVPRGSAHYAGTFDGISPLMAHCVRTAVVVAADKQHKVDVKLAAFSSPQFKERGATLLVRLRFEARPKKPDGTACKRYAERWKACAKSASTLATETHTTIGAREKLAKTDAARTALGWSCATALRALGTGEKCSAE